MKARDSIEVAADLRGRVSERGSAEGSIAGWHQGGRTAAAQLRRSHRRAAPPYCGANAFADRHREALPRSRTDP